MADKELIKIEERNGQQAVNARDLHNALGSRQEFRHWIKNRIEKYGFVENQDFESFDNIVKRDTGATIRKEYAISLDMAKELAMVENNDKGRQIRQYFIAVERKAKQSKPLTQAELLLQSAQMLVDIERKQKEIETRTAKVENELADMRREKEEARQQLLLEPYLSSQPLPEISEVKALRNTVNRLVCEYADAATIPYKDSWDEVYKSLFFDHHINIRNCKKEPSERLLDVIERKGYLPLVHSIISDKIRKFKEHIK